MSDDDNNQQHQTTNETPPVDPKPVGPPNQEIKEDKVVTITRDDNSSDD